MARPPYVSLPLGGEGARTRLGAAEMVARIAAEIEAGRLPLGSRLPPVRVLQHQLHVSKNTVQSAYDELVARGLLESRARRGVFVAGRPAPETTAPVTEPAAARVRPDPFPPLVTGEDRMLRMSSVFIDPELLPRARVEECVRSVLRQPGLATYYDAQGYPPLREVIARRLQARGMEVSRDDVVVTTGSQQAIDIVCRAMRTRRIATENPAYPIGRMLFDSLDLPITPLTLDPFTGPRLEEWEEALRRDRPGLLYAITSFHNPTGYSYTTHELERLLGLSRRYDFALLEDDWGSDMLSGTEYRPTLRALGGPRVFYVNSFTKKLLPSLRLGFVVGDEHTVPSLLAAKRVSTLGGPALMEAALFEFLDRGYYDTHLAQLQKELDRRYHLCLSALREFMPEGVRWTTPGGGPTLWLELPRRVDLDRLRQHLLARGVVIDPPLRGFLGEPHLHGFRVSFAQTQPEELRRGIEVLADTLEEHP